MGYSLTTHFQSYLHSRPPWPPVRATHIPRRPKKKPLRGKNVGSAEKKLRLSQKMAHRVYQGRDVPTRGDLPQPTLSKAHCFGYGFLQTALGFASLAWRVHNTPSPMAGLLHIEIARVVRWVMRMLSALFPRLFLHIRASQGGVTSLKIEINQCRI